LHLWNHLQLELEALSCNYRSGVATRHFCPDVFVVLVFYTLYPHRLKIFVIRIASYQSKFMSCHNVAYISGIV